MKQSTKPFEVLREILRKERNLNLLSTQFVLFFAWLKFPSLCLQYLLALFDVIFNLLAFETLQRLSDLNFP